MDEVSPLRALTRETKALIIVSEFEAQHMSRAQLCAVLDESVSRGYWAGNRVWEEW